MNRLWLLVAVLLVVGLEAKKNSRHRKTDVFRYPYCNNRRRNFRPPPPPPAMNFFGHNPDTIDIGSVVPHPPHLGSARRSSAHIAGELDFFRDNAPAVPLGSHSGDGLLYHHGTSLLSSPPRLATRAGRRARCWLKPAPTHCDPKVPYRTIDGSCNNLKYTNWGRSIQPFHRMLPPKYDVGDMRSKSVLGGDLPSARKVSTTITTLATHKDFDRSLTSMHMLWGQFIDHDLTHTPMVPEVKCCDKPEHKRSEGCIPISIPKDDPFWGHQRETCMELRKSMAITAGQCGEKYREQLNNLTSYIDGGLIYGSTEEREKELRSFFRGQMKVSANDYLPIAKKSEKCMIPKHGHPDKRCFMAGDRRSNVWSALAALHNAFVREHNRIAKVFYNKLRLEYHESNEKFLDEKVYQEVRKVMAAILQVITYKEYLPNTLGRRLMSRYKLHIGSDGNYNPKVNPTISNVFATAVLRFGHTEIPFGTQPKNEFFHNATKFVTLTETFNQPTKYREVGLENSLRGVCHEPALTHGKEFSQEIRDKLFARSFDGKGLDLIAVNMQRGRDHGLPGYNDWRQECGLPRITSFYNMPDHTHDLMAKFARVYKHPDDIDLFIGAITERIVDFDAHIGPTFGCLLARQFKSLKEGDRFWFENRKTYANPFTPHQIQQLRKASLSKVICEATRSQVVAEDVFRLNSRLVRCDDLPYIDLWNWL